MKLPTTIKKIAIGLLAFGLLNIPATAVFADDCTPPPSSQAGVHWPTGADAGTFTYQCDGPYAGDWTNPYYVFDTNTTARTPLYDLDYQYDCSVGQWSRVYWGYSPAQDSFYESRIAASDPGLPTGCPVATTTDPGSDGSDPNQSVSNTGPDSTNNSSSDTSLNSTTTNNNNLTMNNGLNSQATSGNSSVIGNTTGGSALTGDALSVANIANLLQTTSNAFGPGTLQFTANINGDVNGDFMFDPSAMLSDTGPNSDNSATNNLQVNNDDTNNTNAQINNNIDVGANSGDATVADNTTGGDATSGNADAIVNLMNLINSTVTAGHSFVGTVNINGNLNGDILLPQNFIDQLLAGTGPNSSNSATNNVTDNSTTTNNTNEGISNTITSSAQTGNANVSSNTSAGSATSGSAGTNVTLMNLTGSSVVGSNDLLVFVNVLGHWVGMIVNAPTGATTADLGGGITNTGPDSSNTTNNNVTDNSATTNNTNEGINNDVNVHAQSGDASVTGNTTGGNATSGNANTAVNILNMEGSNLSLSNWFGILFINVFGNWTGSFGVNTSAGDPTTTGSSNGTGTTSAKPAFQFVPRGTVPGASNVDYNVSSVSNTSGSSSNGVVLASKTVQSSIKLPTVGSITPTQKAFNRLFLPAIGAAFAFAILFAGERKSRASHHIQP